MRKPVTRGKPRVSEPSDEALLSRIAGGEERASRLMALRYLPRIVALGERMLGSRAEAEDVAQETFMRIWKASADWQPGRARFSTWVHKVATNLCIDRLRKRRPLPLEGEALDVPDPAPDAEAQTAGSQQSARLSAALQKLPERQRLAIVLVHYQELGNREAADILGTSVEAVESLLGRARRTLRKILLEDEGFDTAHGSAASGEWR